MSNKGSAFHLSGPSTPERRERADRIRNRERIVEVARELFVRADAAGEPLSMNEVARAAGVGTATLYRHFPTRDDLAAAVYEQKLDDLTARVHDQSAGRTGFETLQTWVSEFARFMLTTRGMMDTMRAAWHSGSGVNSSATERIAAALDQFITTGVEDGSVRTEIDALDTTIGILALLSTTPPEDEGARATRLLKLFISGLAEPDH